MSDFATEDNILIAEFASIYKAEEGGRIIQCQENERTFYSWEKMRPKTFLKWNVK